MPIYIPDSSKVLREVNPIMVTTADNVSREIAEGWYTGSDNVSRLIYQNKTILLENGQVNSELFNGIGYQTYGITQQEEKDHEIYIYAERGGGSEGFVQGYFIPNGSLSVAEQKEFFYNLYKGRRKICFDVDTTSDLPTLPTRCFSWLAIGNSADGNAVREARKSDASFSGIVEINIAGITIDDLDTSYQLMFGVYSSSEDDGASLTIRNVWIE